MFLCLKKNSIIVVFGKILTHFKRPFLILLFFGLRQYVKVKLEKNFKITLQLKIWCSRTFENEIRVHFDEIIFSEKINFVSYIFIILLYCIDYLFNIIY